MLCNCGLMIVIFPNSLQISYMKQSNQNTYNLVATLSRAAPGILVTGFQTFAIRKFKSMGARFSRKLCNLKLNLVAILTV